MVLRRGARAHPLVESNTIQACPTVRVQMREGRRRTPSAMKTSNEEGHKTEPIMGKHKYSTQSDKKPLNRT